MHRSQSATEKHDRMEKKIQETCSIGFENGKHSDLISSFWLTIFFYCLYLKKMLCGLVFIVVVYFPCLALSL